MRCPKFQHKKLDMQRQMHEFSKDILFGNFRVLIILPIAVEMFLLCMRYACKRLFFIHDNIQ